MLEAVEERGDRGRVAEEFAPVIDGPIGRQDGGCALVAAHDELEQVFGARVRQLPHAEIIDDQQGHGRDVALLDRRMSEGLGHVTLAGARRTEEEDVLVLRDEAAGGELEDERAIEMLAKGEIKGV